VSKIINIEHFNQELPSDCADRGGIYYTQQVAINHKKEKGQFIRLESSSKSLLIPNKNYIFLRRFSTKDDKTDYIAAPYFCNY